ncbi:MAG: aldehyde dehydrogenase [Clostridiales bacterium]|nr:aldehyde dehydrogenase [Clostridiales bacterium]
MEEKEIALLVKKQKKFFAAGRTLSYSFRLSALTRLEKGLLSWEKKIATALKKDLNKSSFESYLSEIGLILGEIRFAKKHLSHWMRPRPVSTPLHEFCAKSYSLCEPYGVTLLLSPWNYPFLLSLSPLVGAIASGNCVVLKPSSDARSSFQTLKAFLSELFPPHYVCVVDDGPEEIDALFRLSFDYIFFTGSPAVGRQVMEKAARTLTPVTLELGGKSPCIVDATADLKLAARRIAFGKFLNAGQTCVAPDYVLVENTVKTPFLHFLKAEISAMYGTSPLQADHYPNIINERHFSRLQHLLEGATIFFGGKTDPQKNQIEPTILTDVSLDAPCMKEEIFGPILPVLSFEKKQEAVSFVQRFPKPLAFYLFTNNRSFQTYVVKHISFGGGCINDTIVHLSVPSLGFGGVGPSGMGAYHGKKGFETFSHEKSIVRKTFFPDLPFRYLPAAPWKEQMIRLFLK